MAGTHSGKFGSVDGVSTVMNWAVVDTMTLSDTVASNTSGGHARRKGIHDWTGSFAGQGGTPPVMPGEYFLFSGYTAPDSDVAGEAGLVYSGQAIVESVTITWNWEGGEIIGWTVNMASNGPIAGTTAVEVPDVTVPDVPEVCATIIEWLDGQDGTGNGAGAHVEWANLQTATLTITAANTTYTNSSTIFGGQCWTLRQPGVVDFQVSVTEQDNDRAKFDKGDDLHLKMYVSATTFWFLSWAKLREFTGLTVDRTSGAILSQTVNFDMNSNRDSDGVLGFINKPDLTEYWPTNAALTTS